MLLQGATSAMRRRLDFWLAAQRLRPRTIGEFDDAALMKAFGGEGRGVFMAPTVLETETAAQYGVRVIGRTDELVEEFYAISVERRITPSVHRRHHQRGAQAVVRRHRSGVTRSAAGAGAGKFRSRKLRAYAGVVQW